MLATEGALGKFVDCDISADNLQPVFIDQAADPILEFCRCVIIAPVMPIVGHVSVLSKLPSKASVETALCSHFDRVLLGSMRVVRLGCW
eukprot:SAG31_NODE_374_length_16577_cov_9.902173_4_plen_89_part_00